MSGFVHWGGHIQCLWAAPSAPSLPRAPTKTCVSRQRVTGVAAKKGIQTFDCRYVYIYIYTHVCTYIIHIVDLEKRNLNPSAILTVSSLNSAQPAKAALHSRNATAPCPEHRLAGHLLEPSLQCRVLLDVLGVPAAKTAYIPSEKDTHWELWGTSDISFKKQLAAKGVKGTKKWSAPFRWLGNRKGPIVLRENTERDKRGTFSDRPLGAASWTRLARFSQDPWNHQPASALSCCCSAGNKKWNDPKINHPTGGVLSSGIPKTGSFHQHPDSQSPFPIARDQNKAHSSTVVAPITSRKRARTGGTQVFKPTNRVYRLGSIRRSLWYFPLFSLSCKLEQTRKAKKR